MNYYDRVLKDHGKNGVLLDTKVLIIFLVGLHDPKFISKFKRTSSGYSEADFKNILKIVSLSSELIVTPQILAELSNFTFDEITDTRFDDYFQKLLDQLKVATEHYRDHNSISNLQLLSKVGYADMSVYECAMERDCLVVTCDRKLHQTLSYSNRGSIHYDDLVASIN